MTERRSGDRPIWLALVGVFVTLALSAGGALIKWGEIQTKVARSETVDGAQWGQIGKIDALSDRVARLEGQIQNCTQ